MKSTVKRAGRFVSSQRAVQLHVSELQIGMYVSEIDKDWLETPFLMQGFMIESSEHIDQLVQYCEYVWVDKVGDQWVQAEEQAVIEHVSTKKGLIHKVPAQKEHENAGNIYHQSRRITRTIMDDVRLGRAIDTETAKSAVSECVQSILRNADALLWMSKIREQDSYTAEHSLSVCVLAIAFGRYLGMQETELNNLGLCGMLHDVGKMQIPSEVLNKVEKLSNDEWEELQMHAVYGRDLLLSTKDIYGGVVDVAYSHHERVDGGGYPRGLKGSAIPNYARIISIVDAYDAMTADRCYAPAMSTTDALRALYNSRDTQFEGRLVDEFMRMIGLYPPGTIVELVNGQVGLVLATNHKYQHLPRIIIVLGEDKQPTDEKVLNLANIETGRLDKNHFIRKAHIDGEFGLKMRDYQEKGMQFANLS